MKGDNSKKYLILVACILFIILCILLYFVFKKNKDIIPNNPVENQSSDFIVYAEEMFTFDETSGIKGYVEFGKIMPGDEIKIINLSGATINNKILFIEKDGETVSSANKGEYVSIVFENVSIDNINENASVVSNTLNVVYNSFNAEIHMLSVDEGGSPIDFINQYRPIIEVYNSNGDKLVYSDNVTIEFQEGIEKISPGETLKVKINLLTNAVVYENQEFIMTDGTKKAFTGKIIELQ